MQRKAILRGFVALALALALGACAMGMKDETAAPQAAMADKSLYDRLGGKPGIEAVVTKFLENVAADSRINGRFAKTDIADLNAKLVDQICEATGGPCKYSGKDMRAAHTGMNVTDAEFNAMGEDLAAALDFYSVPAKEKNELLAAIGGMKGDIVGI